ncbi:hypothetical protein [Budvicia diplopodorum]|uniref:hypothetical protein n=1 Tax=Budvicia diplopodorum TaxID=1119056 RepID=UPI00135CD829|nr:hypothetical protein [Budvicia diplopodorum]
MKKISLLVLAALLMAGCSSKTSILKDYHNSCDAMNQAPDAYVAYVDCMNALVSADTKVSRGNGTINIMATANQYKQQVLARKMTSQDARASLQTKYPRFVFKYVILQPSSSTAPVATADAATPSK